MARRAPRVTFTPKDKDQLPEVVSEGVALLVTLAHRGMIEAIADKVRIRRQGGYAGIDVVLVLLLYFASGQPVGMRTLWKRIAPFRKRLAALAGRKSLPSASSVNRALEAVTEELLRPIAPWLMVEGAGMDEVLRHPCVLTYDRCGLAWHLFDFDPTVTALRHRALPTGEGLPAAKRRSCELAQPGHAGRKRGDVIVSRATLQHAGSSCWLWAELSSGNADPHTTLRVALDVVVATCQRLSHPLCRALFRMDGAFGYVPYYADCREKGVPFLTRLTRPKLFEQPDIRKTLREGAWQLVPSSGAGPVRGALELGLITLPAGEGTQRPDGSDYEPVTVRVVASRYPREEEAEHGVVIEGWQYELFAIDASVESFSAADAVAAYFGRAGQENRFAQEDREAGLDRIYSYHRPGQEFASLIGLWVWNLRVARGFALAPPPAVPPGASLAEATADTRTAHVPLAEEERRALGPADSPPSPPAPAPSCEPQSSSDLDEALSQTLGELDWPQLLAKRRGWRWQPHPPALLCPDGRPVVLTTVELHEDKPYRPVLTFCRRKGECEACAIRASCVASQRPQAGKHIRFSVPRPLAVRLHQLLAALRQHVQRPLPALAPARPPRPPPARRPPFRITPVSGEPGPRAVHIPLFLPARARQRWREAALALTIRVTVREAPPRAPWPELLARHAADRRHHRKRWQENVERYALEPEAEVHITFAGSSALQSVLQAPPQRATA